MPIERRRMAGASLGDVFRRRAGGGWLPALLLASLALHVPLGLLFRPAGGDETARLEAAEGSYLRQVLQKERAREVSREVKTRITMPPPPPDPEATVTRTLSSEIATDLEKVMGKTLDVRVSGQLADRVTATLADELAEAARNIAEGKLSEEQIRKLRDRFKQEAHRQTVIELRRYREKTQVTRARQSVTEWYNEFVSPRLRRALRHELFVRTHNQIWFNVFGRHPCGAILRWNYTEFRDYAGLGDKLLVVRGLLEGRYVDRDNEFGGQPVGHGWLELPGWPEPDKRQGQAVLVRLRETFEGRGGSGGWQSCAARYLADWHPHRLKEMQLQADKADALWRKAIAQAEAYKDAPDNRLAPARTDLLATLKQLKEAIEKIWVGRRFREFVTANRAARSRVFRGPARGKAYDAYVDTLVKALWPAVRDMAENEFVEGILVRKTGIDETTTEFANSVVNLLRRDIQRVVPPASFEQRVFVAGENPYKSKVTGQGSAPDEEDIQADEAALAKLLAKWPQDDRDYPKAREKHIAEDLTGVMKRVAAAVLGRLLDEDGRLRKDIYRAVESVDYTDKAAERLDARARALAGRGQDLARLTEDGVPDSTAAVTAVMFGAAKGHGATLEPVMTIMQPGHVTGPCPRTAIRAAVPRYPPVPAKWGPVTQPEVRPPFRTPRFEAIPFLANFPRLDGSLSDWGSIRPLTLRIPWRESATTDPILVYVAWNYQGFFLGYYVQQPRARFTHPWEFWIDRRTRRVMQDPYRTTSGGRWTVNWLRSGDHLRLFFDTLDARKPRLGHPHTQEFFIFPCGTESCPNMPAAERIFQRLRDADPRNNVWGYARSIWKVFPGQPPPHFGPDGTGPYRVTRRQPDGYTVEVFLPRSLFKVPVFAPGWYVGFDCAVGTGPQGEYRFYGQYWACRGNLVRTSEHHTPASEWGDLLLLGTDPCLAVQNADETGSLAAALIPGHSCLLTVVDPDRNVRLTGEDTVVVSAEVLDPAGECSDVEVYVLKETGRNTSVFRGYVNTQPGAGREVQGVLEAMPGQTVRFGYVDFANARGERNVIYRLNLPVVAGLTSAVARAD